MKKREHAHRQCHAIEVRTKPCTQKEGRSVTLHFTSSRKIYNDSEKKKTVHKKVDKQSK